MKNVRQLQDTAQGWGDWWSGKHKYDGKIINHYSHYHDLLFNQESFSEIKNIKCDICDKRLKSEKIERFQCSQCNYDICLNCAEK